jgi:hypothetical protein
MAETFPFTMLGGVLSVAVKLLNLQLAESGTFPKIGVLGKDCYPAGWIHHLWHTMN